MLWSTAVSAKVLAGVAGDSNSDILYKAFGKVKSVHAAVIVTLPFVVITMTVLAIRH